MKWPSPAPLETYLGAKGREMVGRVSGYLMAISEDSVLEEFELYQWCLLWRAG